MSKYSGTSIFWTFNEFLAGSLRGQIVKNGPIDPDRQIIPPVEDYVTELDTNDAFNDSDTQFEVPLFTPGGQEEEALSIWNNAAYNNLPIATYTVMEARKRDTPWERSGQITYTFYHGGADKLFEIREFISDLCGREDWSAQDANYFFKNDATNPFDFKLIVQMNAVGPSAPEDEGGRYALLVSIYVSGTYEGLNRTFSHDEEVGLGMI